jgi:Zn-dependent protease
VLAAVAILALFALNNPIYAGLAIACYLAVITIHELGHAYVARSLGYDVAAIRVAFFHGSCECEAPHSEWDEVLVSWGGVVAQLAVAGVVLVIATLLGARDPGYFGPVVAFLGYVNLLLALANLAPAAGFDGQTAWRILPLLARKWRSRRAPRRNLRVISKRK